MTRNGRNYEQLGEAGIPGRSGLYRMCRAVLADLPAEAHVLIVGCGTRADLIPLAEANPGWTFEAIEPAEPMLAFCRKQMHEKGWSERVKSHHQTLESFGSAARFDGATSILVSQHLPDEQVADFFRQIFALLKPGGLLYSADIHIPRHQPREALLALWKRQNLLAGIPRELIDDLLVRFEGPLRPREEPTIVSCMETAGFHSIVKLFSSLIYGTWSAHKPTFIGLPDNRT